jgi:hypothetical protein
VIWVYVALLVVFVLAIAILVGTALSRLGATDCDLHEHDEHDEDVDEADEGPDTGDDRDRAKLRHPSAHRPAPAPGFGRGQAPHRRVFLPRPRSARER